MNLSIGASKRNQLNAGEVTTNNKHINNGIMLYTTVYAIQKSKLASIITNERQAQCAKHAHVHGWSGAHHTYASNYNRL